jgi:hypothetical protein
MIAGGWRSARAGVEQEGQLTGCTFLHRVLTVSSARKLVLAFVIFCPLAAGCGVGSGITEGGGDLTVTQAAGSDAGSTPLPLDQATRQPAVETSGPVVTNVSLDYCFAYPEGFAQLPYGETVEVVGPHSGSGPAPGLMWMDVIDAQGRTAEDVANEEVNAVGGLNPPRSTVALGGEDALVLDGMPGQDAVRKVYIVHDGRLYTLTFSPYRSDNITASAQMEGLYASVTSSWEWVSSGTPCVAGN